jgi:hypothetical protein
MRFGRVRVGDYYSVSPDATLGPTVQEIRDDKRKRVFQFGVSKDFEREASLAGEEWKRIASKRIQEFESRQFEGSRVDGSRVRARQWCNTDGEVGNI